MKQIANFGRIDAHARLGKDAEGVVVRLMNLFLR
jgi:hypothetical protein